MLGDQLCIAGLNPDWRVGPAIVPCAPVGGHSRLCRGEAHDAQAEGLSGSIGKSLETGRSRDHGGVFLNRESRGPSGSVSCVSSVWWFFLMLGRNVESRKAGTETVSSEIRSSGLWENAEGARVTEATESRAETTEAGLG